MRLRASALVGLGLALLLASWVVATPPFGAPDEAFHYLRAAGVSNGQWLGPKVPYSNPALPPAQLAWGQQSSRGVRISASLSPPGTSCLSGQPNTGGCVEATTVGNYHPLPYLLPAAAIGVSHTTETALWLSRAASALQCLVFMMLAVALLWNGSALSLVGLLAAITPMVLFVSSVLNPNGLEIAASVALAAGVIRISRAPARVHAWVWMAAAGSGATTILAWQLGPVFAAANLMLLAGLLGRRGARELASRSRTGTIWTGAVLVTAAIIWAVYGAVSDADHSHIQLGLPTGHGGFVELKTALRQAVGDFGLLNVPLPEVARWIWWGVVIGLLALALYVGARRLRVLLVAVVAACAAFPILFYTWVYRFSGFGLQGRYMLPLFVLVPLTAGEIISRSAGRLPRSRPPQLALAAGAVLIAGVQAYAWWYDAGFSAGRPTQLRFFDHATWRPPLGWIPWVVVAGMGAIALLAFALAAALPAARSRPRT